MEALKQYIRHVPDFPKPGVTFYDLTTLLQNPTGYKMALDGMQKYAETRRPDKIVAVEARGFVFGGALADRMGLSLVVARKPGKLPGESIALEYDLEYGTDKLEIHSDAIWQGDRVLMVDDLIATGGTLSAACQLVEKLGGEVVGISSVIGLEFLPYQEQLKKYDVDFLISYDSE